MMVPSNHAELLTMLRDEHDDPAQVITMLAVALGRAIGETNVSLRTTTELLDGALDAVTSAVEFGVRRRMSKGEKL